MNGKKSYTTTAAGFKILKVLELIALSVEPVDGKSVSKEIDEKYGTVMGYIATLDQAGFIEKQGDGWVCSQKLGIFWAKRLAYLKQERDKNDLYIKELEGAYNK